MRVVGFFVFSHIRLLGQIRLGLQSSSHGLKIGPTPCTGFRNRTKVTVKIKRNPKLWILSMVMLFKKNIIIIIKYLYQIPENLYFSGSSMRLYSPVLNNKTKQNLQIAVRYGLLEGQKKGWLVSASFIITHVRKVTHSASTRRWGVDGFDSRPKPLLDKTIKAVLTTAMTDA